MPSLGATILTSSLPCLISQDRHSKKCLSRSDRVDFKCSRSDKSKNGRLFNVPLANASLSCSVQMSLITNLIRPPLYRKEAKPSANTLIADDEKNPNIKSNCVELHRQSEKKPIGSHSVRDLNRRCAGNVTSLSIYIKQLAQLISSSSNRSISSLFLLFAFKSSVFFMWSSLIWRTRSGRISFSSGSP